MSSSVTPAELVAARSAQNRPLSTLLRLVPGLRGRLLLAFIAISLFVVAAGAAGLYALHEVGQTLDRITLKTVPAALDAHELSRKSEKIVAAGPALVNATDASEVEAVSSRAAGQLVDASTVLTHLRAANLDPGALDEIGEVLEKLGEHLSLMRSARLDGIAAADQNRHVIADTFTAYHQLGGIWQPRFADLRSQVLRLKGAMTAADSAAQERGKALDQFDQAMIDLFSLDQIQREAGVAFELIIRAADASEPAELAALEAPAQRSIRAVDGLVSDIDPDVSLQFFDPLRSLRGAAVGDASIFNAVRRGIAARDENRRLIAENETLSTRLKAAVDQLVSRSRNEIEGANLDARRVQGLGRSVLLAVAGLSLASSFLIVWLYVGRNIVARLTRLSGAMIEIASGARQTAVPAAGSDEVAAMGHAVEVFRRNAIELDELLAERAEAANRLEQLVQERTADLQESLEYQTATSDVLKVISGSSFDIQPVFDTISATAARLCGSDSANITMREGEVYRFVSNYGLGDEQWAILRERTIVPGRQSTAGRVALEGRVVHVADLAADPDYALPESVAAGWRTSLGVPLLRDGAVVGTINMGRRRVEPFTERQIELVRTFADQAVIAIENARLLRELQARTDDLQESLEYQTATSDVLKVISGSNFDIQPVFDTIIATASRLCGSDTGGITMREGEVYRYVSTHGYAVERGAILRERTIVLGRQSVAGMVALEGRVVQVADITAIPDYALPETVASGTRTILGVPLLREGAVVGTINLGRQRVEPFTERQIELVRTFAYQAVIAIENARLLGELQARTDELTRSVAELQALEEVLRAVNSSLDLDTVLATIVSRAAQLSQADEGTIYEFDEAEEVFVPKSAFGMSAERVEALRERKIRLGETHLGRAAVERAPVYVQDVRQDPSVVVKNLPGIHAVLAVPLLREDKVIGGLVIRRRSEAGFAPTIPTLLQTFAGQAVLAIENARLFQELGQRGEEARRARTAAEAALADLRRAQDRLVQSEKMASLGQLTAGIAHEIKNPLNFVNNFAGLSVELL